MNIKCPRCGIVHNCNFCPNCGLQAPPTSNLKYGNQPFMNTPKPKKKMHGCLIAVITFLAVTFIFAVIFNVIDAIVPSLNNAVDSINASVSSTPSPTLAPTDEEIKTSLLEFDSKSWEQFKSLYITHNNLLKTVSLYSDYGMTSIEFYSYCKDFKKYFQNMSLEFGWGETEDEKTYLEVFEIFALADQQATEHLIKYRFMCCLRGVPFCGILGL